VFLETPVYHHSVVGSNPDSVIIEQPSKEPVEIVTIKITGKNLTSY
jgi:hypothetical protein